MKTNCDMQNAERGTPSSTLSSRGGGRDWWEIRNWQSGFTIVEVILVVMIIAILAVVAIPKFNFGTSSKASVDGAAYIVASDIRYAQEWAMANWTSKSVSFTSGQSSYTSPDAGSPTYLPSGVTISNNFSVTFNSLGEPSTVGGWSVTVSAGGLYPRTLTVVNYTGKVNIS